MKKPNVKLFDFYYQDDEYGIDFPLQTYHWSEPKNESGYEKHSTYGHMVVIKKESLLEILRKQNKAIVFEISISFEDSSYRFYGEPSKPTKARSILSLEIDEQNDEIIWREHILPQNDN